MPDTRPGLNIGKDGLCDACRHYEKRKDIDWDKRQRMLRDLADNYRRHDGNYDCIIAASAGKDSYFQTHVFKEQLDMNPLLVMVNNYSWTETGLQNWNNLLEEFGVDAIQFSQSPRTCKIMFSKGLEKSIPTWYFDRAIYTFPLLIAARLKIPLIVYGENVNYEYGGLQENETSSARQQMNNSVANKQPVYEWLDENISKECFASHRPPDKSELQTISPIYLSYYFPWSGYKNMMFARTRGFKTLDDTGEWKREGFIEQYDQIDTVGYLIHPWFKFAKFGHYRTTDIGSSWIREGRITREEVVEKVIDNDWKIDQKMLDDFLGYINCSRKEFWDIVEKYINRKILEKREFNWRLKKNVEKALISGGKVVD